MAKKKETLQGRIRYEENWHGEGEHYLFELKQPGEESWGLSKAFALVSYEDNEIQIGKGDFLNYRALTQIREWMKLGIPFHFA